MCVLEAYGSRISFKTTLEALSAMTFATHLLPTPLIHLRNSPSCRIKDSYNVCSSDSNLSSQNLKILARNPSSFPRKLSEFGRTGKRRRSNFVTDTYVATPTFDPNVSDSKLKVKKSHSLRRTVQSSIPVSWGLLWSLAIQRKLRLAVSIAMLVGCTTCTISMPILSGTLGCLAS